MRLTMQQIELARHALGLPNPYKRSYRNRYIAGSKHPSYADWQGMVKEGLAKFSDGENLPFGGSHLFFLTRKGAEAVLSKDETLCSEDFPALKGQQHDK